MPDTYSVQTYDDAIPLDLRSKVWDYLQHLEYCAVRKIPARVKVEPELLTVHYVPADNKKEYMTTDLPQVEHQYMHRTILGDNEKDLAKHHPLILELWNHINNALGNRFIIDGDPEKIASTYRHARVYVNAQPTEWIKKSHTVHRDTIDLNEETHYTLLYVANMEWYPTWMAENVFYSSGETGDHQQWQAPYGQARNFPVGWPFAIVSPKPGRIILYDGRNLHTTKPASIWAKEMRYTVAFRVRKIV